MFSFVFCGKLHFYCMHHCSRSEDISVFLIQFSVSQIEYPLGAVAKKVVMYTYC